MVRRVLVGLLLGALAISLVPAEASHKSRVYVLRGQIRAVGLQYTASGQACVTSCAASAKPGSFSFFGRVLTSDSIIPPNPIIPGIIRPGDPIRQGVGTMTLFWPDDGREGYGSKVRFSSLVFTSRSIVGLGSIVSGARRGLRVDLTIAIPTEPYRAASSLLGALVFV